MIRAENVLNSVIHDERTENIRCFAECYQNGREQGFQIWGFIGKKGSGKAVLFSECRNSDYIVVYVGEYSMHSISEDAYKHQHRFSTHEEASEFVVNTVVEFCKCDE